MGVQAFGMNDAYIQGNDVGRPTQSRTESPCGVFAEHQVLSVGQGERLFIGSLDCGLHSGAEGRFGFIDERQQRQFFCVGVQA